MAPIAIEREQGLSQAVLQFTSERLACLREGFEFAPEAVVVGIECLRMRGNSGETVVGWARNSLIEQLAGVTVSEAKLWVPRFFRASDVTFKSSGGKDFISFEISKVARVECESNINMECGIVRIAEMGACALALSEDFIGKVYETGGGLLVKFDLSWEELRAGSVSDGTLNKFLVLQLETSEGKGLPVVKAREVDEEGQGLRKIFRKAQNVFVIHEEA